MSADGCLTGAAMTAKLEASRLRNDPDSISIFSPFGLGALDLTVGSYAYELALEQGIGTKTALFFDATRLTNDIYRNT